jgi:hypothetical protein
MVMPTSSKSPITQTGVKGFLIWFQREQPGLFDKIAPQLPKVAPKAFGHYLTDRARMQRLYKAKFSQKTGVAGFGDTGAAYSLPELTVSAPVVAPITVNYTAQLTAPSAYAAYASTPQSSVYAGSTPTLPPVTAAANSGSLSTPVVSAIGAAVGAASAIYMTNQQAALQQSVIQSQLARAAAGLPPLNTSLAQLGVPTVAGGGVFSSSSGLLLLALGIGAVMLLSSGSSSAQK